jgi:hypothetical protein
MSVTCLFSLLRSIQMVTIYTMFLFGSAYVDYRLEIHKPRFLLL